MSFWQRKDSYKPFKPAEKDAQEKATALAEEHRRKLKEIGQACFADPKFKKYKDAYEMMERLTFDQARHYVNPDPVQYAMVVSNMFRELNTFEALISDVETDANKKLGDGK